MHATICYYAHASGPIAEVMRAGRALTALVSQAPGFISYVVLDRGRGALMSVSVFETQAELENADRLVARWMPEHLDRLLPHPPVVRSGEVVLQHGL